MKKALLLGCMVLVIHLLWAQQKPLNIEFRAGHSFGALVPFFSDVEAENSKWHPEFNPSIGVLIVLPFFKIENSSWLVGITYEKKSANVRTDVINQPYILEDDKGVLDGSVSIVGNFQYLNFPILIETNFFNSNTWRTLIGGYFAFSIVDPFLELTVYEGSILMLGDGESEFQRDLPVEYSDYTVAFDWGTQVGIQKEFNNRWSVDMQMICGLRGIYDKNFDLSDPNLYQLYGQIGVSYKIYSQ